jgi:hypothetical protein
MAMRVSNWRTSREAAFPEQNAWFLALRRPYLQAFASDIHKSEPAMVPAILRCSRRNYTAAAV